MAIGKIRIGTEIDTKSFDKQANVLEKKINELEKSLLGDLPLNIKLKNEAELERLQNQLIDIKNKSNDIGDVSVKSSTKMSDGFKKSASGIKRFALSLISVGSIFALISKASTSYLATDDKLTSQIESNWIGLGTILEPVISFLVNLMKKGVTSILYFMSQLTGVDYIAKANASAIKKQTQATNDLAKANSKYSASFDEMNIAQDTSLSSGSSAKGIGAELFSVNDIGEDAKRVIEQIAKALKPVKDIIKNIINWALDNPKALATILGGTAVIGLISKIIGSGTTGLLGIKGALLGIAAIGVISIGVNIKKISDQYKSTTKVIEEVSERLDEKNEKTKQEIENYKKNIQYLKKNTKETNNQAKAIKDTSNNLIDYANQMRKADEETGALQKITNALTGESKQYNTEIVRNIQNSYDSIQAYREMYNQGLLNEEQTREYKETLENFNNTLFGSSESAMNLRNSYNLWNEEGIELNEIHKNLNQTLKEAGIETNIVKKSVEGVNTAIKNMPKNTKLNIESSKVNTAKNDINKLKSTMESISKKTYKLNMGVTFSNAGKSIIDTWSSAVSNIESALGIKTKTTKMAVGGIVNNPGRGVSINDIRTGESGAEGIIPLTDPRAMEELGSAIGRYISVNLTNYTYLDNKQIQRNQKKVSNELSFATNGRL